MSTYRRILRGADQTHTYWVALEEEKCIGQYFHTLRDFCEERGLSLSADVLALAKGRRVSFCLPIGRGDETSGPQSPVR